MPPDEPSGDDEREHLHLVVLRCDSCGDTFPVKIERDEEVTCRSCGSTDLGLAHEPLL